MKRIAISLIVGFLFIIQTAMVSAQTTTIKLSDVPTQVPEEVLKMVDTYLQLLTSSKSVVEAATKLFPIAGGHLLSTTGDKISSDVKQFSLKKDWQNAKFYQQPAKITRVDKIENDYDGYDVTLIEGTTYKIWVDKKQGVNGMPAPMKVLVPKNDPTHPKVISNIGSF